MYLDSAAINSYISNLSLFDAFSNNSFSQPVEIGDGSKIDTKRVGNIGKFTDIYYAPDLAFNLMSVNDLLNFLKISATSWTGLDTVLFQFLEARIIYSP